MLWVYSRGLWCEVLGFFVLTGVGLWVWGVITWNRSTDPGLHREVRVRELFLGGGSVALVVGNKEGAGFRTEHEFWECAWFRNSAWSVTLSWATEFVRCTQPTLTVILGERPSLGAKPKSWV